MTKKKNNQQDRRGASTVNSRMYQGTTLREEITGKTKVDADSILKLQHLHRLATWAGGEGGVHALGAFLGSRLAACSEVAGVPIDPSSVTCERCESILQPGFNCTIRIEKNKGRQSKKSHTYSQNNVVYTCHFCCHRNLKAGTWKGHVKDILASRPNAHCSTNEAKNNFKKGSAGVRELDQSGRAKTPARTETIPNLECSTPSEPVVARETPVDRTPMTPLLTLENPSKKKRKTAGSMPSKVQMSGNNSATVNSVTGSSGSRKRRRKGWSSLKDIVASKEAERRQNISNFVIPFLLPGDKKDDKAPT